MQYALTVPSYHCASSGQYTEMRRPHISPAGTDALHQGQVEFQTLLDVKSVSMLHSATADSLAAVHPSWHQKYIKCRFM